MRTNQTGPELIAWAEGLTGMSPHMPSDLERVKDLAEYARGTQEALDLLRAVPHPLDIALENAKRMEKKESDDFKELLVACAFSFLGGVMVGTMAWDLIR